MIEDFFKISLRNLNHRKLRSLLTLLGIIISITTIFVLITTSISLSTAVEEQFRLIGTDKFYVQPRGQIAGPGSVGATELTIEDVETIERVSGVRAVSYMVIGSAKIEFKDETRYLAITGMDADRSDLFFESGSIEAEEGRIFGNSGGDSGKVLTGYYFKHRNVFSEPVTVGDTLIINDREFDVKASLTAIGNAPDDKLIYMSIEDFRDLLDIPERIDVVIVQTEQGEDINEVAARVEKKLLSARDLKKENQDFSILTPEELLESIGNILNILTAFLLGVAGISLLVGGVGIANTMFTSVLERTKEIGIMKAIGSRNSDILLIFLIEAGLLGLIGGSIGILFGIGINELIEFIAVEYLGTTLLKMIISPYLVIGCLAFAFLSGALSGLWPAWRATKVKPVEALRYE
jgi:putative ABC transport system permease protein